MAEELTTCKESVGVRAFLFWWISVRLGRKAFQVFSMAANSPNVLGATNGFSSASTFSLQDDPCTKHCGYIYENICKIKPLTQESNKTSHQLVSLFLAFIKANKPFVP